MTVNSLAGTIASRIRGYRAIAKKTQLEVALDSNSTQNQIWRLENEGVPYVSVYKLKQVASALGVTVSHLTGEVGFHE